MAENDYESSEEDEDYPGAAASRLDKFSLTGGQETFFAMLTEWEPLAVVFDLEKKTTTKRCLCPCGKHAKQWRETDRKVSMVIDDNDHNQQSCGRHFNRIGIMAHLKEKGQLCILHFGTRAYIEKLSEIIHRAGKQSNSSFVCDAEVGGLFLP